MQEEIIYGYHAVMAVVEHRPKSVAAVWLDEKREDKRSEILAQLLRAAGIRARRVPRAKLDQLAGRGTRHQGVVARIAHAALGGADLKGFLDHIESEPFLLVLDSVQDPHNLGACLRSADAAGTQAVILPKDKSAPLSAVTRRAASGAVEVLPIFQVSNLARTLTELKDRGIWILGAAGDAEADIYHTDFTGPLALVLGSEGKGLRRLTRSHCDGLVRIPIYGSVASLNVSVAAGICLFEARRQRQYGAGSNS